MTPEQERTWTETIAKVNELHGALCLNGFFARVANIETKVNKIAEHNPSECYYLKAKKARLTYYALAFSGGGFFFGGATLATKLLGWW